MIQKILIDLLTIFLSIMVFRIYGDRFAVNVWVLFFLIVVPVRMYLILSPGLPPITLVSIAILPVFLAALAEYDIPFRLNWADYIVILLCFVAWVAGWVSSDFKFGFGQFVENITEKAVPYFLIRMVVQREGVLRFLYCLAIFISIMAALAPFEYFFNLRSGQIFQLFWPDSIGDPIFVRDGHFRVFSNFGHPIHSGLAFCCGLFISFFLLRSGFLSNSRIVWLMIAVNSLAIFMTVSRSSYIVVVPILALLNLAFVRKKLAYAVCYVAIGLLVIFLGMPAYQNYIEPQASSQELAETQTSAMYRAKLMDNYISTVYEKPIFGWGFPIPVIDYQSSIDNYYLFSALQNGGVYAVLFILLLVVVGINCLRDFVTATSERRRSLLWLVFCLEITFAFMCTLVWLATTTRILLWIVLGCGVSLYGQVRLTQPRFAKLKPEF